MRTASGRPSFAHPAVDGRCVVLLLPGQGAQRPGMSVDRYVADPEFAGDVDSFFELMGDSGRAVRADWLSDRPLVPLDDASRAQPLLFAIGYARGRALRRAGVVPTVLIGHSVGELAAACLAGVFNLAGAARIMNARLEALAGVRDGGLLAVAASAGQVQPYVDAGRDPGDVVIGAVNAPKQIVLAGAYPRLHTVAARLREDGFMCRAVPAQQPFHSPAVAKAAVRFAAAIADVPLRPPSPAIQSTATGGRVSAGEATRPDFWAGQMARPVLFWPALDAVLSDPALGDGFLVVEAGEAAALSPAARRHPSIRSGRGAVVRAADHA